MIDATTFSASYHALWKMYAPTCELFVRRLNMDGYERFDLPLVSSTASSRRALTAEYAFALFKYSLDWGTEPSLKSKRHSMHEMAWGEATRRLGAFGGRGTEIEADLAGDELTEAVHLARRLWKYFDERKMKTVLHPIFSGCGFISASEGDILSGTTIFEVKTVDRTFRGHDIRQLMTYAALNFASKQFSIDRIGLFNPRRGVFCDLDLNETSLEISGRPASELLWLITSAVSSGDLSR
jgi:hypothetical protein